jgi:WD40 repeat protein/serine/threonine protein kinase
MAGTSQPGASSLIGRRFGEFVVTEPLSSGGFGAVFRAEQAALGREAVIKVLHARLMSSEAAVQRFLREARLASRLDHPYAAHTYAFGAEPDGVLWIAMEYVRGTPLDRLLEAQGPIPLERFVPLLERICEVVHTAHEEGIVHRDLKPANVMVLARAGRLLPKLLDFGIAKIDEGGVPLTRPPPAPGTPARITPRKISPMVSLEDTGVLDPGVARGEAPVLPAETLRQDTARDTAPDMSTSASSRLTQIGAVMGSPFYMAPEQWSDAATADSRTDLYALGILSYEALTGRPPFPGPDVLQLAYAHAEHRPPPLGAGFPPDLDAVLARVLAKSPRDRHATALEFASAFRAASGIATEKASLPRLDDDVRTAAMAWAPRPVALAIDALDAARNAHQARDALWRVVHTITRFVALAALASHSHVGADLSATDPAILEVLRRLRGRALSDAAWLELARGLVRPFCRFPEAHPIPALVEFLIPTDPHAALPLGELLALREQADEAGGGSEEEVAGLLERALPHLGRLLERFSFVHDYPLVVPIEGGGAEEWIGVRPERPRRAVAGRELAAGRPVLLDKDGTAVVTLWPFVQVAEPSPGAAPQLFFFEGRGHRGARLVALPDAFERDDDELWESFGAILRRDDDAGGATTGEDSCPFPGLASFTAADADSFFGRERETDAFLNRLRVTPLLAVVGPSGAGKSSFVQAGVVPRLPEGWEAITMRPGAAPLVTLAARLAAAGVYTTGLTGELVHHPGALGSELRTAAVARRSTLVLIVDQLEELFTLCDDPAERVVFAEALARAARSADDPVRIIFTLRDDFLLRAEALPPLQARLGSSLQLLNTPAPAELHRILVEPIRRAGYEFDDPALPDEIVEALAGAPGALALLSFTASKLWELRDRRFRQIHHKAYRSLGGVGGALAQHAEATLQGLPTEEKRLVREVFRHAVTAEGTRAVLRRSELDQLLGLGAHAASVIEKLVGARLLTVAESEDGHERIEIAHEALLHAWPRLVGWRREDAEGARLRDQLRAAARQWDERARPSGLLWRGDALAEYRLWRARHPGSLTATEEAFTAASLGDAARGRRLQRLLMTAVIVILAAVAVVLLVQNARVARQRASARASAEKLHDLLLSQYEEQGRRLLLADDPLPALAYLDQAGALGAAGAAHDFLVAQAVRATDGEVMELPHGAMVWRVRYSPDGARLLTAAYDGRARIWDARSGALLHELEHDAPVIRIEWSGDGTRVVTAALDGSVALWDAATGARSQLLSHDAPAEAVVFSPDGARLVTATAEGAVRLWHVASGQLAAALREAAPGGDEVPIGAPCAFAPDGVLFACGDRAGGLTLWNTASGGEVARWAAHRQRINVVRFSPDGARVLATSDDDTASLWTVATRQRQMTFAQQGDIGAAAFSPDGRLIATGSRDRSAIVWDAATGDRRWVLEGHAATINQVAFSPDGALLATSSDDASLQLWDMRSGRRIGRRVGHRSEVKDMAFDARGRRVATASFDGTVRIWTTAPTVHTTALRGHTGVVSTAVFSPDGTHVATAGGDGSARVWDAETGREVLAVQHEGVQSAAYSPDGKRLATGGEDGVLRVWDVRNGALLAEARGHTGPVRAIAWHRRGALLASASDDGSARLWAPATGAEVRAIRAHGGGAVFSVTFAQAADIGASTGEDNVVRLWDPATGGALGELPFPEGLGGSVGLDPAGARVAVATVNRSVRIVAVGSGATESELIGHLGFVLHVSWRSDGQLILTTSTDATARIWDPVTGNLLGVLKIPAGTEVVSAGFSPDGQRVVMGRDDGDVEIWDLPRLRGGAAQLAKLVRCRVPYEVAADRVVSRPRDPTACAPDALPVQ